MKQHSTPVIISNGQSNILEKVSLGTNNYNEAWIQSLCFEIPTLLPFKEIEPTFTGMIPICKELSVESGAVDLIYVNENGFITIGECKLWRNPEARRKVIGQILDYAKDISKLNYSDFERRCLKARNNSSESLFEVVCQSPDVDEAEFIDSVQTNLRKGRFLLAVIGDGIRENMEELADFIQRNGSLNFSLSLIELPVYRNPLDEQILVTPRVLIKTTEIERVIYTLDSEKRSEPAQRDRTALKHSISEKVFYERLDQYIGEEKSKSVRDLISKMTSDLNLLPKLGRGKRLSLNIKSPDDTYNFASIQENGEVYFYGIVLKTDEIGNKNIGIEYLKSLADLVSGQFDTSMKEWNWCVKKQNKYLNIVDYLPYKNEWIDLIEDTLQKIQREQDED